eukprot:COSAG05_NODE_1186_length_5587_cov_26.631560_3_plen_160_part_00
MPACSTVVAWQDLLIFSVYLRQTERLLDSSHTSNNQPSGWPVSIHALSTRSLRHPPRAVSTPQPSQPPSLCSDAGRLLFYLRLARAKLARSAFLRRNTNEKPVEERNCQSRRISDSTAGCCRSKHEPATQTALEIQIRVTRAENPCFSAGLKQTIYWDF